MKQLYVTAALAVVLSGCAGSNDFTPAADASGEDIFKLACAECHSADVGKIYDLDESMANAAAVKTKIGEGSMAMPGFPNIKGAQLDALADYVLANSNVAP